MYNTLDFPSPKYRKEKVKNRVLDRTKPRKGIKTTYIARATIIISSLEGETPAKGLVLSFLIKPLINRMMPSTASAISIALGKTAPSSLRSPVPHQTMAERSRRTMAVKVSLFHTALFPSLRSFSN